MDNAVANVLANILANNNSTRLKVLDLSSVCCITSDGWQALFNALQSPQCILEELHLADVGRYNKDDSLTDDLVIQLSNSLANNSVLRCLNLGGDNDRVTASGWRVFSAVLQNPNSALERVNLADNAIGNDLLISISDSLRYNSKLKDLFISEEKYQGIQVVSFEITNWDALSNMLCNESSIDATFNSNHTLQRVIDPEIFEGRTVVDNSELPADFRALLLLNRENTEMEAARCKILKVHFSDFTLQPFIDMDLKALPHAIAWMARDGYGSNLLYQFLLEKSGSLLDVVEAKSETEPKHKRKKM